MTVAALADAAGDVRDGLAARAGIVEAPDKIWFHRTAAAVIDAGRCVGCAGCIASCPSASIGIDDDGRPTLVRMCTGCSSCWDFCPLGGLRSERLPALLASNGGGSTGIGSGPVRAAYEARAKARADAAQDGGVVTALLTALLERGIIDGAIVTRSRSALDGETVLATSPAELAGTAGSVYDQTLPLALLARPLPPGVGSLALVGTPCQLNAFRALERFPWRYRRSAAGAVSLTIALFCTRSFDPGRLRRALRRRGIDPRRVTKVDVRDGQLAVVTGEGERTVAGRVEEFGDAGLPGCDECADFSGALADIAVGNVGSAPGSSTVLVRTDRGRAAWEAATSALEQRPLDDLGPVVLAERRNRLRALRNLRRAFDPDASLWVPYDEHLRAYADSERHPVPPPPHRSHHYRISC